MSEHSTPGHYAPPRDGTRPEGSPATDHSGTDSLQDRLLWLVLLPSVVVLCIAGGVVGYVVGVQPAATDPIFISLTAIAFVTSMAIVLVAVFRARNIARDVDDGVQAVRSSIVSGDRELRQLLDQWQRGERLHQVEPMAGPRAYGEFEVMSKELHQLRRLATAAIAETAVTVPAVRDTAGGSPTSDHRVGVFVNLARRLQSLVHREIQLLDDLEAQVEDPDLLKGLFAVDHLATRIRRHAENLAVLGGAVSRRQWSRPVNIYAVLRSAVAEVEQYSRVKLARPFEGHLQGHVVADVVHLVAELVENATQFSAPQTQVVLRAEQVTSGLAIEVEDRGLGIPRDQLQRLNNMLTGTDSVNMDDLLQDGRIGLFVVSTLARRHGIAAQLQTNIYGGVQAVIVLPRNLLGDDPQKEYKRQPVDEAPAQEDTVPSRPTAEQQAINAEPPATSAPVSAQPVSAAGPTAERKPSPDRKPRPVAGNGSGSGHVVVPVARTPDQNVSTYQATDQVAPTADDIEVSFETQYTADYGPVSSTMSTDDAPMSGGSDDRPRLPQRRKQTHIAPQLAESTPAPEANAPAPGHDPGLMASFQRGFQRADEGQDETGSHSGQSYGSN